MNLAPVVLEHGTQFGNLTVLEHLRKSKRDRRRPAKYRCGCKCGHIGVYKGSKLRQGKTRCDRCEEQHKCKDRSE